MRKLIAAVAVGFIVLAGVAIVGSGTGHSTANLSTLTTTSTTKPSTGGWTSFVASTSDSVFLISWHRVGSSVGGMAMEDVITRHPMENATTATDFTGTVSGDRLSIHFQGRGLDYVNSLRGRIDHHGFTATFPGNITPIRFRAGSIRVYASTANRLAGLT